jgi:6-aminohexanoate-oligomer exohydrolase
VIGADLSNWLEAPFNRWAFQHVAELLRTVGISRREGPERGFGRGDEDVEAFTYEAGGRRSTIGDLLERSATDGFLVLRGDTILYERYDNALEPSTPHALMSVSKPVAGTVAAELEAAGLLDPDRRVDEIVPELADSAYGDATVRHLLDMSARLRFSMEHDDPASEVQTEDRAAGWRPRGPGDPPGSQAFLAGLAGTSAAHGSGFQYSSATTDVLAWVVQTVAGRPYAELVSEHVWSRLGAAEDALITVDALGFPYACAGISATLRDIARFGRFVLDTRPERSPGGSPVSSAPEFEAIAAAYPQAEYHDHWWTCRDGRGAFFAWGIFDQYLWLDPVSDVVVVKFSSGPLAYEPAVTHEHVTALGALAAALER